jgi:large subunit ribosomal protein L10
MAISKEKKEKILEELREKIAQQKAMVFVGIAGLKVKDISELREKIRAAGGDLKVAKKTLIEIVLKENNFNFDKSQQKEEAALLFSFKDEVAPVKVAYKFKQENDNLKILGGFISGKNDFEESEKIITLAQLPSRDELLAKMVGSISAPVSGLIGVLQGNIKGLIQVLAKAKTQ